MTLGPLAGKNKKMSSKYRIFASLLHSDQFTVGSLADASGENPHTVRTVLSRCKDRFAISETRPLEAKRGGQWKVYRISPRGKDLIRAELSAAFGTLPPDHTAGISMQHEAPPLLLSAAAEHINALENAPPEGAATEFLVDTARRYLNLAKREVRELHPDSRAHAEQTLLSLEKRLADYRSEIRHDTSSPQGESSPQPVAAGLAGRTLRRRRTANKVAEKTHRAVTDVSVNAGHVYGFATQIGAESAKYAAHPHGYLFGAPAAARAAQFANPYAAPEREVDLRVRNESVFRQVSCSLDTFRGAMAEALNGRLLIGSAMDDEPSRTLAAFIQGGLNVILDARTAVKEIDSSWLEQIKDFPDNEPACLFLTVNSGGEKKDLQDAIERIQQVSTKGLKVIVLDKADPHPQQFENVGILPDHYFPQAGAAAGDDLLKLLEQSVQ
jgi:hypothetical protein